MRLSESAEGNTVSVQRVVCAGALKRRLMEMGVIAGARIRIVKYAPLRDPIELSVGSSHISLRVIEAAQVEVEPIV